MSRGVPGMVPSGEPNQRLQEPALSRQPYGDGMESMVMLFHVALTAPRQGIRCSYPPVGHCRASMSGHHHACHKQWDAAPTRIVAAVRQTVTAAGSDGPVAGLLSAADTHQRRLAQFHAPQRRQRTYVAPGDPSFPATCIPSGRVGSMSLQAMPSMTCTTDMGGFCRAFRICSIYRCATSRDAGAWTPGDAEEVADGAGKLLGRVSAGIRCGEDLRAAHNLNAPFTAFLINP